MVVKIHFDICHNKRASISRTISGYGRTKRMFFKKLNIKQIYAPNINHQGGEKWRHYPDCHNYITSPCHYCSRFLFYASHRKKKYCERVSSISLPNCPPSFIIFRSVIIIKIDVQHSICKGGKSSRTEPNVLDRGM